LARDQIVVNELHARSADGALFGREHANSMISGSPAIQPQRDRQTLGDKAGLIDPQEGSACRPGSVVRRAVLNSLWLRLAE
jgi:hypothetical protein